MEHVFSLALGPVQDFIVAARRTRDLWYGSWLLSELARAAGKTLRDAGHQLAFPDVDQLERADATFTNKILAVLTEPPSEVAELVTSAIHDRLRSLREEAFRHLAGQRAAGLFLGEVAERQTEDLIEVQWASAEISSSRNYSHARALAEALLAGQKNTRLFKAVTWGAPVPKSAIDGHRESVLHENLFGATTGPGARQLFATYRVGEAERLCGVSLLKRLGRHGRDRDAHHFLSTGHLAAWPLLERLEQLSNERGQLQKLQTAWLGLVGAIEENLGEGQIAELKIYARSGNRHPVLQDYDASLLFEDRLPDLFSQVGVPAPERRRQAKPLIPLLRHFLGVAGGKPRPYYAILVADGDQMGKTIERVDSLKQHQQLSSRLTDFARAAKTIVEDDHRGELVLAGGDDVLAFVPLHLAVSCARSLADSFKSSLAEFGIDADRPPSLSVGIGVSHFMEPLSRALEVARRAERLAKVARNSLAVSLDKRSGPLLEICGHWDEIDRTLDAFVELHVKDQVPDGLAFELRELARLLDGAVGTQRQALLQVVRKETRRILGRKKPNKGKGKGLTEETLRKLRVLDLDDDEHGATSLSEFANRLIVARLFAEAKLQANPASKETE